VTGRFVLKALIPPILTRLQLKEPAHEIITINSTDDDATTSKSVQELMGKVADGTYGKKVLLKINPVDI
jgi:hypothetical protein